MPFELHSENSPLHTYTVQVHARSLTGIRDITKSRIPSNFTCQTKRARGIPRKPYLSYLPFLSFQIPSPLLRYNVLLRLLQNNLHAPPHSNHTLSKTRPQRLPKPQLQSAHNCILRPHCQSHITMPPQPISFQWPSPNNVHGALSCRPTNLLHTQNR